MWLAARDRYGGSDEQFRRRILDYLAEGDISPTLERLVDAPHFAYAEWQEELGKIAGSDDARELRGNTARLLASHPDHPGMLLARAFSELADATGDARELAAALETSLQTARSRYGVGEDEIESLVRWLIQECVRRRRRTARTAVVGVALDAGAAGGVIENELDQAFLNSEADIGLLVLALAASLDRAVRAASPHVPESEGATK